MKTKSTIEVLALVLGMSAAPFATAHAHFKLLAPDSWVVEDDLGGPQKGSPCGPKGSDEPTGGAQYSMKTTTVHAGDTIKVEIQETVYHPGYFRVSLSPNQMDFMDPPLTDQNACSLDLDKVGTEAHGNVLVDGIAKTDVALGSNRHLMQDVKIPDMPCDNCTLQVMQVMKDHGPPNCFYYHCANLKILPAGATSTAGSGAAAGSSASTAGSSATAGASGSTSVAGGSGGATPSSSAGKGGSSTGSAGSSTTTTPTSTATAGKSGTTPTTGTTSSGQTAAAGSKSSAAGAAAPSGGTAGAATTTPAATPAEKSGGCSVTHLASSSNDLFAFGLSTIVAAAFARRFKKRSGRRQLES